MSDAAAGGQVLMDEETFRDVKERLDELAAIDHNGFNSAKLKAQNGMWWKCWG